jgi:hypothetical protein
MIPHSELDLFTNALVCPLLRLQAHFRPEFNKLPLAPADLRSRLASRIGKNAARLSMVKIGASPVA